MCCGDRRRSMPITTTSKWKLEGFPAGFLIWTARERVGLYDPQADYKVSTLQLVERKSNFCPTDKRNAFRASHEPSSINRVWRDKAHVLFHVLERWRPTLNCAANVLLRTKYAKQLLCVTQNNSLTTRSPYRGLISTTNGIIQQDTTSCSRGLEHGLHVGE